MHKGLIYIKGYAKGKELMDTLKAVNHAVLLHENQYRKTGEDYVEHPMHVTKHLLSLGLDKDSLLAAAMLHDTIEDCSISPADLKAIFTEETCYNVEVLSKTKKTDTDSYYSLISKNPETSLIKIADRCHNVSTMADAFSIKKIKEYIEETELYVIPLCKSTVIQYPEYSDAVMTMKYHIESICYTLKVCIEALDKNKNIEDEEELKDVSSKMLCDVAVKAQCKVAKKECDIF